MTRKKATKKSPVKKNASSARKRSRPMKKDVSDRADTYQASKQSAYGDDKPICKNAKCRLRKASCAGFTGCPGFKY